MNKVIQVHVNDVRKTHKNEHEKYEHYRRILVEKGSAGCTVSHYEIPPGKSAYPYHCHKKNEESFYILSGKGILRTPAGERKVSSGDFFFFPAGEDGAHKLTNTSDCENLVYLDFDTVHDSDVCIYPDSMKIGVYGKNINKIFMAADEVEYYDGE